MSMYACMWIIEICKDCGGFKVSPDTGEFETHCCVNMIEGSTCGGELDKYAVPKEQLIRDLEAALKFCNSIPY